jgi:hypothetical protein
MKIDNWFLKEEKHGEIRACKDLKSSKSYCVRTDSQSFKRASSHGLAPRIKKQIGKILIYDSDSSYRDVSSDLKSNAKSLPLVLKSIAKLHRLGLTYNGKIYVDKAKKHVHFTKFSDRTKMSPIDWVFELIKDYETLIISNRTEYTLDPELKKIVSRIDKAIKKIATVL